MAEDKDIALLADNDIIVEIEVQEAPTVVIETPHTTTAEISGDSAFGIVVGALPKLAKEATLISKVAELKDALNSIDFTAIEQAIQNVEDVTAKEATLIQGVADIIKAVENIDFTDLENSIAEVKNAVANIDFSALAKESTLTNGVNELKTAIENIDLTPIENKVQEGVNILSSKIDNIDLSAVENKVQEESAAIQNKLDNLNVEVDLSSVSKQGENQEATNTKILEEVQKINGLFASQLHDIIGE